MLTPIATPNKATTSGRYRRAEIRTFLASLTAACPPRASSGLNSLTHLFSFPYRCLLMIGRVVGSATPNERPANGKVLLPSFDTLMVLIRLQGETAET